ncbi:MAG: N-acetyl-gamma-glutamyl-phosphate reductase [Anaerolineales bacterium]|nr:N-acetyl-gamma-glutamyl-phosphate reductase [Anaerolineales bacterium]
MVAAGVVGSTGYTGVELIRILTEHPEVELGFAVSKTHAGKTLENVVPGGTAVQLVNYEAALLDRIDVLFLCLPHGRSAPLVEQAYSREVRVIDLSADFRLQHADLYPQWYGHEHTHLGLLGEAVYGLPEVFRPKLKAARLVANPGCYPTSVLLALYPLFRSGLACSRVIIDAKSGVSGAGRTPTATTHFVEVSNNLKPYQVGAVHRHVPEMEQFLREWRGEPVSVVFSPHLLPTSRGLLSTIYVSQDEGWDDSDVEQAYSECYRAEPFINLLGTDEMASLAHVNHTNSCAIGWTRAGETLVITSAIDNLIKGASGQAVQNMNVIFGFDETTGLRI